MVGSSRPLRNLRRSRPRRCGSLGSGSHQNVETRATKLIQPAKTLPSCPPTTTRSVAPLSPADTNVVVVHREEGKETPRVVGGGGWWRWWWTHLHTVYIHTYYIHTCTYLASWTHRRRCKHQARITVTASLIIIIIIITYSTQPQPAAAPAAVARQVHRTKANQTKPKQTKAGKQIKQAPPSNFNPASGSGSLR